MSNQNLTLVDKARDVIRLRHYALSTEEAYLGWIARYQRFLNARRRQLSLAASEQKAEAFLTDLAIRFKVSASTQNQAFSALLFLYDAVLKRPLQKVDGLRARQPVRERDSIPKPELLRVLGDLRDTPATPLRLIVSLLYGSGLRLCEGLDLRIKDVQLGEGKLVIREPKHGHDRAAIIPCSLMPALSRQIDAARLLWKKDQESGLRVQVPEALGRKYPHLGGKWQWYWLFPAGDECLHPRTGQRVRWRVHETAVQRGLRRAAARRGLDGRLTPHVLRHCFGTHFSGDIQVLQKLLGHKQIQTTTGYRHPELAATSPLDEMPIAL